MGFLRRVLRGRSAPAWASFMTAEQYAAFEEVLAADLRARGWTWRQRADGLFVDAAGEPPHAYGLTNLAQLCAAIERAEWPDAIRSHFDHFADQATRPDPGEAWDDVRSLLRLRIVGVGTMDTSGLVAYPLCAELEAVLAIDYPTTVSMVPRAAIDAWPPVDELYRIALDNLRADPMPAMQAVDANGITIALYFDDSFFTASRLLLLRELDGMAGAEHAIVAVPNRHTLLVHAIADARSVGAVAPIASMAAHGHRTGPGSIVPDVYWWHAGALTRLPTTVRDKAIDVYPPDAFVELLNGLAAAQGD